MRVGAVHAQEAGACMHRYIYVAFVLVFISLLRIVGTLPNLRKIWSQSRFPAFNFRFLGSCMVHLHSLRGVCAGVVVEIWVISLL